MMTEIYNDLLTQYNKLSDEEKNAILIYKSKIFFHINEITSIKDFENETPQNIFNNLEKKDNFLDSFNEYKDIINKTENLFIRKSIFSAVNFDNVYFFIESLKSVISNMVSASKKITINSDITVYRGVGIPKENSKKDISKGNIISTTTDIEEAEKFMFYDINLDNTLYVIKIMPGSNVLVAPYSITINYDNNRMQIKKSEGISQNEIILLKNNFEFIETNEKIVTLDDDKLTVKYIKSAPIFEDVINLKK